MQWAPRWIHGSPKTVPSGKASRVPVPIAPKRSRPGCSAVTDPVRCTQAHAAWTARWRRRRRQDENVFLRSGTRSPYSDRAAPVSPEPCDLHPTGWRTVPVESRGIPWKRPTGRAHETDS
ncbi:hypothetical protein GCM10010389_26190 [Streptomyces echinoruber]|uniref:Uncharacterized protein n=1 Tax=Streptomyces echinoruber TaxID=68898 RepID=A0A918R451_9ACTN|nr:hypothetical protein GCM10010389_26190 [Streptomyces echinoruber]